MNEAKLNLRKAAILVATLDARTADALLERMPAKQVQSLRGAVRALGPVNAHEQSEVVEEFFRSGPLPAEDSSGGVELDASLAQRLAAEHCAQPAPESAAAGTQASSPRFGFLHEASGDILAPLLVREHPQTVAVVLSHLPPEQAAELLVALPAATQADVARRLVDLEETDPEVVREVERGLEAWLSRHGQLRRRRTGSAALRNILAAASEPTQRRLAANLAQHDPHLAVEAEEARVPPLTFADLVALDDALLGDVLRGADAEVLVLALAGADSDLVERVLAQLPAEAAKMLRYGLDHLGPTRLSDVEESQRRLAEQADELLRRRGARRRQPRQLSLAA